MRDLRLLVAIAVLTALPAAAAGQTGSAPVTEPASRALKTQFDRVARYLVASAEKMPEANYPFKPTPEVRSFGEILGHVANAHYMICARAKGEKNPNQGNDIEKKTTKAEIAKALSDSVAYCSAVYNEMTEKLLFEAPPVVAPATPPAGAATQGAKPAPPPAPRINALLSNITHDWEHYGNLVTYLRIKGLVPPSSER